MKLRLAVAKDIRAGGAPGSGLSLVRDIVDSQGGKVWAESVDGKGATFHVVVPAA